MRGGGCDRRGGVNKKGALGKVEGGGVDGGRNVVWPLTADGRLCNALLLCCLATALPKMHNANTAMGGEHERRQRCLPSDITDWKLKLF